MDMGEIRASGATGPVRIEEVAAVAGVSRSTVSRVVNGSPSVSPTALESVRKAIAELNFVPNRAARSLASRHTHAIALIVPEATSRFFGDPFFGMIVAGIDARLRQSDYVMNIFIADGKASDKTASFIRGGTVDGAMIVSHHASDSFIESIISAVPVVFGGRPLQPRENEHHVDVNNVKGGREATEYLIGRGKKRLATITGPLTMAPGIDRLQGFREAIEAAGLPEGAVEEGDFTPRGGADAIRRLLAREERPDAVFVASDHMARGVLAELAAAGLRVPEDISIIGYDDSPSATSATPHLTTMRQPSHEQGERMADVMLELLAGGHPPRTTILEAVLVERDSV